MTDKSTKKLLVLGTASDVGKSIMVTGLCKILSEKYKVAPFKAQNMSLNSWITKDGKEIGIAQAVQAKAAGVDPTADMNPVLLKPKGDRTSQVIILGEPYADKSAGNYYDSISETMEVVKGALDRLGEKYELIVMEGAGGAAEINLYDRDIVNVGTARLTQAPIILVGNIESGGVFASLYGTVALLPEDIRGNIKGFVINKFRGDPAILEPGLRQLEEMTGIPVLGVLPYYKLNIPSEDSMAIYSKSRNTSSGCLNDVDIAVIRLPRISNFTDFEPLERLAKVRYVELHEDLGTPDCIIIPGTKNTISDLLDLKASGMDEQIRNMYGRVPIFGICGGYQMLGKTLHDSGIENGLEADYEGLGLLEVETAFGEYKKTTTQVKKKVVAEGPIFRHIKDEEVWGYEIHMGKTVTPRTAFGDDGSIDESGTVIGTYLHGLFENSNIRTALMIYLAEKKGVEFHPEVATTEEEAYKELADIVRSCLDMDKIYAMIEKS
ncbi:MAG: cobyric acid synthase [Methanomethylovorans sp. PtaU1.Bin093]|jgi:adenosylcobyric acid synthase|uniref:cobyric acid synthase n=1 Tax=Methanomethylovorans sp. PtaU1.Bin093 TaxID=1811679 RepID=UPI0009D2BD73|nr:cobyric acid synthase [Methanomethylovorans sp. PtaU1.Bin093]OPY20497.1 MAG: cobyric acid synthase [Methanomethylovorans sp. PtaU1.Bin093]